MGLWRLSGHAGRRKGSIRTCRTREPAGCCMCTGPRRRARSSTSTLPRSGSGVEKLRPAAGRRHMRRVRCVAWAQGNDAIKTRAAHESARLTGHRLILCSVDVVGSGARAALSVARNTARGRSGAHPRAIISTTKKPSTCKPISTHLVSATPFRSAAIRRWASSVHHPDRLSSDLPRVPWFRYVG